MGKNHPPVINCAYGYQKETQKEARQVEKVAAKEEATQQKADKKEASNAKEKVCKEKSAGQKNGEK
ncbi:MAG: hypothetical protein ACRD20_14795 [Terriglobales bacterium]